MRGRDAAPPAGRLRRPGGHRALRTTIARWIARSRGVHADPADVVVTSGTANAVDLVARVMLDPGDVVAVEEPGYPPVVTLLRAHRAEVHHVPVDDHGIVVEALPASARLVVVTPSHQYPTGATLSHGRRLELLAWAADAGAAIVEDDYDTELRYTSQPLEPLQRLDRDGRVIYVGTFSKSLSPGSAGRVRGAPTLARAPRAHHPPGDGLVPAPGRPRRRSLRSSRAASSTATSAGPDACTASGASC